MSATPAAERLIKVLEDATGMPLSMHGDEAALILDNAGIGKVPEIARLFGEGDSSGVADRGNNGFQVSRYAMGELRAWLSTLTGENQQEVNNEHT